MGVSGLGFGAIAAESLAKDVLWAFHIGTPNSQAKNRKLKRSAQSSRFSAYNNLSEVPRL